MAKPARNSLPDNIVSAARTFFATTKTSQGRPLLQSERNATLMIDVLRSYVAAGKFQLHDFVIMPNHVHLLMSVGGDMTIEKAMQFIKGGFSYRLKERGSVWQPSFTNHRIRDWEDYERHREYIRVNPVRARLAPRPDAYPYSSATAALRMDAVPQGLKPCGYKEALTRR